jgi:hypothetical protein
MEGNPTNNRNRVSNKERQGPMRLLPQTTGGEERRAIARCSRKETGERETT